MGETFFYWNELKYFKNINVYLKNINSNLF